MTRFSICYKNKNYNTWVEWYMESLSHMEKCKRWSMEGKCVATTDMLATECWQEHERENADQEKIWEYCTTKMCIHEGTMMCATSIMLWNQFQKVSCE